MKKDINGILLLDKPNGWSSNKALQKVKWLFQAKKAGHTGTLDPLATGMLPICFGKATKLSNQLLSSDKVYETTALLGVKTDTGDAEGEVLETKDVPDISDEMLETVLNKFRGDILQVPPMYSALKQNGVPLYKLARQGKTVKREPRAVTIHECCVLSRTLNTLHLTVRCSKGTYIRTLVEDIGEALGCGAHVSTLRRLSVSPFDPNNMITLDELISLHEKEDVDAMMAYVQSPSDYGLSF